jgi:ubiquinone/menaquinone biosynthesis C-methylase UbiE
MALPLLVWLAAALVCWRHKFSARTALWMYAVSVPVMNLLPSTSHDYKLVLLYAPLAICLFILLDELNKTGKRSMLLLITALMVLAFFLGRSYELLPGFLGNKYPFVLLLQILFLASILIVEGTPMPAARLKMLPLSEYVGVNRDDPIRFYNRPVFGSLYRQRVEYCLGELTGGDKVLEIGFGSGVAFLNLHDQYRQIYGLDLTADTQAVGAMFKNKGLEVALQNGSVLEMPYEPDSFDAVLLVSILEHLKPIQQQQAFSEIARVLKPGGQVVYGVPVDSPTMVFLFRLLGYDIRQHHFSTERQVSEAAQACLSEKRIIQMNGPLGLPRNIYQVGHFVKPPAAGRTLSPLDVLV